jgi:hypothetical protein
LKRYVQGVACIAEGPRGRDPARRGGPLRPAVARLEPIPIVEPRLPALDRDAPALVGLGAECLGDALSGDDVHDPSLQDLELRFGDAVERRLVQFAEFLLQGAKQQGP